MRQKEKQRKKYLLTGWMGMLNVGAFVIWTALIRTVDVQPIGQNGTDIGFASFNAWFHNLTGVHMAIYNLTDWMALIPISVCTIFGVMGFGQLLRRKSLCKVDYDIIVLGVYYIVVILLYLLFDKLPINYRPILIEGKMEVSYPSSTTLLVLCVMPTLMEQVKRRMENVMLKRLYRWFGFGISLFMVLGRLICGVHWFTDIVGGVLLSAGLFLIYKACVLSVKKE